MAEEKPNAREQRCRPPRGTAGIATSSGSVARGARLGVGLHGIRLAGFDGGHTRGPVEHRLVLRGGTAATRTTLVEDVERDGEQEHHALDELLVVGADAHERHAVVEHTHDEATRDGTRDGTDTTRDGGTTDEGCRDRVELEQVARAGAGRVEATREDEPR